MKNIYCFKEELVDLGGLQVSIFEEEKKTPISDVKIKIIRRYDYAVIEELVTDTIGKTDTAQLAAPPLEYSLNEQRLKPYSEYDLSISADGYEPIYIRKIQILPKSKALLVVHLKPIQDISYATRTISISEHTLWGNYPSKLPEADAKILSDLGGREALAKPVIPEYVTVHLGVLTNMSVRDVQVSFKDYVKNVASSEIYDTWTRETIKANVLAIVSFVVNRIYTQWYKENGNKFTITNSTAIDQAFVYGRNIFENISNIVDDIFTTYITKPEINQPLLIQHYDGVKIKCERGLSKWGSKNLGDKGYDSLKILRNYYGEDIYLTQAKKIEGVTVSYPGTPLKIGSIGVNVRIIQQQLNAISNKYIVIPKLKVDGIYGENMYNAVKIFQTIFNMQVIGVINFATWYEILRIYRVVNKLDGDDIKNVHNTNEPYRY